MSIGPDAKAVYAEVGVSFTILRDSGNITGEYLVFKPNSQVTKPFIQEFFLEASIAYDTDTVAGDIIQFVVTSDKYLVMNNTPILFVDEIYKYASVLYKTNVSVDILRPSESRNSHTYQYETTWTMVKGSVDALLTTPLYGHSLESDEELGLIGVELNEFYIPSSIGVQVLDRIRVAPSEYYRVETVKKRRYSAVDVIELSEDTRLMHSTTTTTTTTTSSTTTTTTTTA